MRNLSRKVRGGFTLIESIISCSLLGTILITTGMIYQMGANAWAKTRTQSEMLQAMQTSSKRLTIELENSCPQSLTVSSEAVAFLSARDDDGTPILAADGTLIWQKYVIYYYDQARQELLRKELPLVAGSPQQTEPAPIEEYLPGTPLANHLNAGIAVARDVKECEFNLVDTRVELITMCERQRYGRTDGETLSFRWEGRPYNS